MIKIAICDDLDVQLEKNKNVVEATFEELGIEIEIDTFLSGEELLKAYQLGKKYNIILMDYQMKGLNGMEVTAEIRKSDQEAEVIFISDYATPAVEGYEMQVLGYILKNDDFKFQFEKTLKRAVNRITKSKKTIEIKTREGTYFLKAVDILYFEAHKRKVIIFTINGEIIYSKSLDSIEEELKEYNFVRVHRSFLINIEKIRGVTGNEVMVGESREEAKKIPIGDKYRSNFVRTFAKWQNGKI